MSPHFIGTVAAIPEGIRDFESLNLWLKKGIIRRWAVVYSLEPVRLSVFDTPEEAVENVVKGAKIVQIDKQERDTSSLLDIIRKEIKRKRFVQA